MRNIEEEALQEECCLWKRVLPQVSIPLYIVMAACAALRLDCQVTVYCSVQNPAGGGGGVNTRGFEKKIYKIKITVKGR